MGWFLWSARILRFLVRIRDRLVVGFVGYLCVPIVEGHKSRDFEWETTKKRLMRSMDGRRD